MLPGDPPGSLCAPPRDSTKPARPTKPARRGRAGDSRAHRSPLHRCRAPSWWPCHPKPILPQPANFPHADGHLGEATPRGVATALQQSTPGPSPRVWSKTPTSDHTAPTASGYHVLLHPVREENIMAGTNQQPLLGNYEFQVTWSMAGHVRIRLVVAVVDLDHVWPGIVLRPICMGAAKVLNGCEVRDRSGNRLGNASGRYPDCRSVGPHPAVDGPHDHHFWHCGESSTTSGLPEPS